MADHSHCQLAAQSALHNGNTCNNSDGDGDGGFTEVCVVDLTISAGTLGSGAHAGSSAARSSSSSASSSLAAEEGDDGIEEDEDVGGAHPAVLYNPRGGAKKQIDDSPATVVGATIGEGCGAFIDLSDLVGHEAAADILLDIDGNGKGGGALPRLVEQMAANVEALLSRYDHLLLGAGGVTGAAAAGVGIDEDVDDATFIAQMTAAVHANNIAIDGVLTDASRAAAAVPTTSSAAGQQRSFGSMFAGGGANGAASSSSSSSCSSPSDEDEDDADTCNKGLPGTTAPPRNQQQQQQQQRSSALLCRAKAYHVDPSANINADGTCPSSSDEGKKADVGDDAEFTNIGATSVAADGSERTGCNADDEHGDGAEVPEGDASSVCCEAAPYATFSALPSTPAPRPSARTMGPYASQAEAFLAAATVHLTPIAGESRDAMRLREEKAMLDNCAAALVGEVPDGCGAEEEEEEEEEGDGDDGDGEADTEGADAINAATPKMTATHTAAKQRGFASTMAACDDLTVRSANDGLSPCEVLATDRFPEHVSEATRTDCHDALAMIMAKYGGGGTTKRA